MLGYIYSLKRACLKEGNRWTKIAKLFEVSKIYVQFMYVSLFFKLIFLSYRYIRDELNGVFGIEPNL
jgi:hypothetical protein